MPEKGITSTPVFSRLSIGGSSSVRRRSLISHNAINQAGKENRNDDEAERLSLVTSERSSLTTSTPSSPRAARDTMSSAPAKEHFQGCLKLYAENKITKDNAWNLQLIDFMTSMLKRHDSRMENLQTASTVIDASTRIYSFRVDSIHYEVLKMAGGLIKATQSKRGKKDDEQGTQDEGASAEKDTNAATRKKKKKSRGAIAANPETLNGDFESNDFIDPFFERLAATTGDVTSSNRAFNATLPIDDKTLTLRLNTDEPFLEPIEENMTEGLDLSELTKLPPNFLPMWTEDDHICEPFTGFSISNWDPDTEDTDHRINKCAEDDRLNLSQQAFAIDVNAEVEPIPIDEAHNDLFDEEPLGGVESEEEADVGVAASVARAAQAAPAPPPRLADTRPAAAADSRLEYSYSAAVVAAWAGPAHWRLKNNRASRMRERSETNADRAVTEAKRPARTKRPLDFSGVGLAFDCEAAPGEDYERIPPAKIMISRKTLSTGHTWSENNYRTPVDRGLDGSHFRKLYLRPSVLMYRKTVSTAAHKQPEPEPEPAQLPVDEAKDYDYNNENDASYCPNSLPEGDDWVGEEGGLASDPHEQAKNAGCEDIGDMLEPPTKVAKIFIPYAVRAKKIDMKQLKSCTWRLLTEKTSTGEKVVTPTTFVSTYARLPNMLSSSMRESLSVPLALHSNKTGIMC
ncbi:hypothetical protein K1T71_005956 [Dendrolimus kikuchii]|uniref:Uncharacterized protein n=1 Tax=Dendrolimus kikuchii TaxID=765133 RepID=A0ACC1D2H5_9NEOP|nr:hypothetical protein K1T71_005956 [Dendrolimus kikuchii]